MNTWFECKVKYQKIDEVSGKEKKVNEPYLVDALSFTEAETRITEQIESMVSGEFSINNIKRVNYTDVFNFEDGDRWFKCKVMYVDVDEASGKEKKTSNYMLVLADNIDHAYERLHESLADMIVPFEVPSIAESPIMDIFPYFDGEQTKEKEVPKNLRPLTDEEYTLKNNKDMKLDDYEPSDDEIEEIDENDPMFNEEEVFVDDLDMDIDDNEDLAEEMQDFDEEDF